MSKTLHYRRHRVPVEKLLILILNRIFPFDNVLITISSGETWQLGWKGRWCFFHVPGDIGTPPGLHSYIGIDWLTSV